MGENSTGDGGREGGGVGSIGGGGGKGVLECVFAEGSTGSLRKGIGGWA